MMRLSLLSLIFCCSVSHAIEQLQEITVEQATHLMQQQQLSSVGLTQYYLQQIALVDDAGSQLKAIVDINPEALQQAEAMDAERKAGKVRSPLHGMPVVLKANIATADQLPTTAGALALKDFKTATVAALVTQLHAAVAGYPSLSLPGGFAADLPLGLSLIGLPWSEQKLIEAASF